jgi:hypothetical protein
VARAWIRNLEGQDPEAYLSMLIVPLMSALAIYWQLRPTFCRRVACEWQVSETGVTRQRGPTLSEVADSVRE